MPQHLFNNKVIINDNGEIFAGNGETNPVLDVPDNFITELNLSKVNNTTIQIDAGWCYDSANDILIKSTGTLTVVITASGENGLDTGSEAANTWYYVYVIMKIDGTIAGLLSTNSSSPTLPSGYTYYRRVGAVRNDGNSNIIKFNQQGKGQERTYYWYKRTDTTLQVLNGGTATSWTDVDCSSLIPATSTFGFFLVEGENANIRPNGEGLVAYLKNFAFGNLLKTTLFTCPTDSSQIIEYKCGAGSLDIAVVGYKEFL